MLIAHLEQEVEYLRERLREAMQLANDLRVIEAPQAPSRRRWWRLWD
jgi:hypothetical protein